MADPRHTEPHNPELQPHPADPELHPTYRDPAADPRLANRAMPPRNGARTGLITAGIIAALLVIALIAFSGGPATDSGTTAVIPDQTEEMAPPAAAPEPQLDPAAPAPVEPAPSDVQ